MTWTGIARQERSRRGLRYPSDMTDREWLLTAPFIPPAKSGGRRRTGDMREVLNVVLYIASNGCAWRMLPKCFPPVSTVRRYFYAWRNTGLFANINTLLVMNLREIEGREASPSAGVIDRQSVKTTESGGVCGDDAGKKIKGRKRHIVTDTCGFLIFMLVHAADVQERDGAVDVLKALRFPAAPMGGRTHLCMARPMQAPGQGLGNLRRVINRLGSHRFHSDDHPQNRKVLLCMKNFRIRLLAVARTVQCGSLMAEWLKCQYDRRRLARRQAIVAE